jgi:hypothetical protein
VAGAHGGALNIGTSVLADLPGLGSGRRQVVLEDLASGAALVRRYQAGGGTARRAEEVLAAAWARQYMDSDTARAIPITHAELGADAGVIGAALVGLLAPVPDGRAAASGPAPAPPATGRGRGR